MRKSKPQKRFRNFVYDSSIPGGIRLLLSVNMVLAAYFFIISIPLSLLMYYNPAAAAPAHWTITVFGWTAFFFLLISIYPIWSTRLAPRFWSFLNSLLLVGYGGIWIYVEISFLPLGFLFIILGAVSLLFMTTGYGPRNYYRKERVIE